MVQSNQEDEKYISELIRESTFLKFQLPESEKIYIRDRIRDRIQIKKNSLTKKSAASLITSIIALFALGTTVFAGVQLWNVVARPHVVQPNGGGFISSITFSGPYQGLYPYGKETPEGGLWKGTKSPNIIENHFHESIPIVTDKEFTVHDIGGQSYGGNPNHLFIQTNGMIPGNPNIVQVMGFKDLQNTMYIDGDTIDSNVATTTSVHQQPAKFLHFETSDGKSFNYLTWQEHDWTIVIQCQDIELSTLTKIASSIVIN